MKKQFVLVGDGEPTEKEKWILNMMNGILEHGMEHFAFVGWRSPADTVFTARYRMDCDDIARAASHLQFDAIDQFIIHNLERYREMEAEPDEEEYDEDQNENTEV